MTFIDENGIEYKMQLRQSNSIFYIKTVSSIFIPTYVIPNIEQTWIDDHIESWKEDGIDWEGWDDRDGKKEVRESIFREIESCMSTYPISIDLDLLDRVPFVP